MVLKPEMLEPADAPITTANAKKLFKQWMLLIAYLDKQEVGDHVRYFADDMKEEESQLKSALKDAKEQFKDQIADSKSEVAELRKDIKKAKPDEIEELEEALAEAEEVARYIKLDIEAAEKQLANFQEDKRAFLVQYINQQVHGG